MTTEIIIKEQKKGPTLRLNFTIASTTAMLEKCQETKTFKIKNLAEAYFRVILNKQHGEWVHNLNIMVKKLMKQNTAKGTTIKMSITCRDFSYSHERVCPEHMTDWVDMGNLTCRIYNNTIISATEVCMKVYSYTENTPGLIKFFEDSDLTDFKLSTGEGSVPVHRAYLGARSDVFKAMLTSNWKETDEGLIEIKGVTLQTLKHLKEYLYLGTLPNDGLRPLLALAAKYCIEDLKAECITKLALTVLPEDVHSLMNFACHFGIPDLCLAFAQLTPDNVIQQSYEYQKKLAKAERQAVKEAASATE